MSGPNDPQAISVLEGLYLLEAVSFVRYVVEVSRPPVFDQADQRALALYQDIYRDVERSAQALSDLLEDADVVVDDPSWPLQYTSYNFLRPRYLLGPVLERAQEQREKVEARARELRRFGWQEADEVLGTVLRRERSAIERLEKAVAELEDEPIAPPKVKGTSASRW